MVGTNKKLTLSYSKINTYLECRKRYWWEYEQDLTPKARRVAPSVGDVVHRLRRKWHLDRLLVTDVEFLQERVQQLYPDMSDDDIEQVCRKALRLFDAYINQWDRSKFEIASPEVTFELECEVAGQPFVIMAKLDGICKTPDGRLWRDELKTSSRTDPSYLAGLRNPLQTGIYHWVTNEVLKKQGQHIIGTVFTMLVDTKVPQCTQTPHMTGTWLTDLAKQTVYGVAEDILTNKPLYPSTKCLLFYECPYLELCRSDTPAKRENYTSREEVKQRSKDQDLL